MTDYYKLSPDSDSENVLKIGQYLTKLYGVQKCAKFLGHPVCVRRTGGVFEHHVEQQVRAVLSQAVDDANSNPRLFRGIRLHFDLEFIPAHDSFAASRAGKIADSVD